MKKNEMLDELKQAYKDFKIIETLESLYKKTGFSTELKTKMCLILNEHKIELNKCFDKLKGE